LLPETHDQGRRRDREQRGGRSADECTPDHARRRPYAARPKGSITPFVKILVANRFFSQLDVELKTLKGTLMSLSRRVTAVGGVIVVACAWIAVASSNDKDKPEPPAKSESQDKPGLRKTAMKAFMRKKLSASQEILEGLALEDFELIESGAKQLKAMATAAEFTVVKDPLYDEFADDFRKTVSKLQRAAKEKRIDGSTLAYMDITMSCVECHKHVRTILIAR